jgi:hypothetical protein
MAFWKFTGAAAEFFPELDITAQPGYVYDLGAGTPPLEELPREGQAYPLVSSLWTSDPGPATDGLVRQATDFGLRAPIKTGTATLVAGTVTVANTSITTSSIIRVTNKTTGGTIGIPFVSAKAAATSFTITSSSNTDTSVVYYEILAY